MPDPTPTVAAPAAVPARRGRFIPLHKQDLLALLRRDANEAGLDFAPVEATLQIIEARLTSDFLARRDRLLADYALFDPDTDLVIVTGASAEERERRAAAIFAEVRQLLEQANFRGLDNVDIDRAIRAMSHWGVNIQVDLDAFAKLEVFARGERIDRRRRRTWQKMFYPQTVEVPLYQRLAVAFRMIPEELTEHGYRGDLIYLRLFKNIPEVDVDMVLPGTRVRMTVLDHGKIIFPTLSGLSITAWKIFKGALVVAAVGVYGLIAYLGIIIGTIGYGWRSFFGYLRTKEKYQLNLTQSLYYQILDSNAGAIVRLLHEAEQQELREAITAWYFLWRHASSTGWTIDELDQHVERFLQDRLRRDIDFDAHDAFAKLTAWNLIEEPTPNRFRARND
ncbi:MAG: DUF3754 domain-containing protein [Planctomycetaceae bacterium]|nr:DUF3754 domain-containing protein [Planctomycetaceae bacterium]